MSQFSIRLYVCYEKIRATLIFNRCAIAAEEKVPAISLCCSP